LAFTDSIPARSLSLRFAEALAFAEDLHAYQNRKESETPYIAHLLAVCGTVLEFKATEEEAIAALLIDAPEQGAPGTLSRIRDRFGERVAAIILHLSDRATPASASAPWIERKRAYLRSLRQCDDMSAYFVCTADRLHAVRRMMHEHRMAGESVWMRFNSGKPGFVWYHEELVEVFRDGPPDARRASMVDELAEAVDRIKKHNPARSEHRTNILGRAETGEAAAL
jgi:GTP pyrophosphokinase